MSEDEEDDGEEEEADESDEDEDEAEADEARGREGPLVAVGGMADLVADDAGRGICGCWLGICVDCFWFCCG